MRIARALFLVLTILCLAWVVTLLVTGGSDLALFGRTIRTHDAKRPLLFGSLALVGYILAGGGFRLVWRSVRGVVGLRIRVDDRWMAATLAAGTLAVGIMFGTMSIGGSDSYGYVSEAELMLQGRLTVSQPWVAEVPWPAARWSFSPLAYRPVEGPGQWDLMPVYAPGLPMLMAAAKLVAGQCAMYLVVPLLGAIAVLSTFGIGRRLGSSRTGLIAAWLVATSPAFLFMLVAPMSDVAVAGAWAAAFYFLLGPGVWSAVAAGLLAAVGILIRPNLFFVAGIYGLWYLVCARRATGDARRRELVRFVVFGLGSSLGVATIAALNWWVRGNPLESGYGGLEGFFELSHILPNLQNYTKFFVDSQTPLALAGVAALFVPLRRLWPGVIDRAPVVLAALVVFAIGAEYATFLVFDAWWYLRFFLPCYPFVMLGLGSVARLGFRSGEPVLGLVMGALVIGLGLQGIWFADRQFTFALCKSDHKYVAAALLTRDATPENSVILSMQHSGSIRYYGGRVTLKFDGLEAGSYDTAMTWLASHGVHPYALLEEWEVPVVKARFAGQKLIAEFDANPAVIYLGSTKTYLFDLLRPVDPDAPTTTIVETYTGARCVGPAPAPHLVFRQ